ncbi:Vesicle coat protein clathrin, light chain [Handroanthus impetiginosus]|uniref:Clathrin light chain n=1 Tax=Handroanthus impetiginosus TaxID=429701 RepID=A0A2G9GLT4_9LAMI|nr:Vesicle coat protein clathrin, light chain [Handroanthus impetiginosus]
MEAFDEGVYMGTDDVVEENVRPLGDGIDYGFDGHDSVAPPPMDGFSGSPVNDNNDMHTPEVYGFSGSPNDYSRSPFEAASGGGGGGDDVNPYDMAADNEGIFTSSGGGPLLPDPSQMREEGAAFREWRRQNAIYLEEKEKKEKELRNQIIAEAEEYKRQFYEKRNQNCETNKAQNREREKLYHAQQEKFHKEADKHFWKAVAEIIPHEVPNIEKRRGKKEEEKKPSILVIQGPKPGKPTDMSRIRQILSKLKQTPPPHMMPPPPEQKDCKDTKDAKDSKEGTKDAKSGKVATPKASEGVKDAAKPASPASGAKPVSPTKDAAKVATPKTPKPDESSTTEGTQNEENDPSIIA